jgi:hypothetical protein
MRKDTSRSMCKYEATTSATTNDNIRKSKWMLALDAWLYTSLHFGV